MQLDRMSVVGAAFCIVALRLEPQLASDPGVFLSMFDGVWDGDRLYIDRWDHKDPGFYWLGAVAFGISSTHGPAVLDGLLLVGVGFGALRLATLLGCSKPSAVVIAIGAMGFVTQPAFHATGLTEPPAVFLLVWSYVYALECKPRLALCLVGFVAIMKLGFLPIALPVLFLARPGTRRQLVERGTALVAPVVAACAVLAMRGELRGWVDSILFNREYAGVGPVWFGASRNGILGHIERLVEVVLGSPSLLATVTLIVLVIAIIKGAGGVLDGRIAIVAAAVFLGLMSATFLTAHMLRAGTVALILLLAAIHLAVVERWGSKIAIGVIGVLALVASGPHPTDIEALSSVGERWGRVETDFASSVQGELSRLVPGGTVQLAFSMGPPKEAVIPYLKGIELACPDHHLLPWFESRFEEHLNCLANEASHVVVGPLSYGSSETMQRYQVQLDAVLAKRYELVGTARGGSQGEVQIYARTDSDSD